MSNTSPENIQTSGGSYIDGNMNPGADFIGRDKITINLNYATAPFRLENFDLAKLRSRYLQALQEYTTRLDFKGLRLIETIEKASGLFLDDLYVSLRTRPELPMAKRGCGLPGECGRMKMPSQRRMLCAWNNKLAE